MFPFATDPTRLVRRPILFESYVETNDVDEDGGLAQSAAGATADDRPITAGHHQGAAAHASIVAPPKNYYGVVLGPYKYIEWPDGEKELYDLEKDPYELNNVVRDPDYFPAPSSTRNWRGSRPARARPAGKSRRRSPSPARNRRS
jgi:hypothetical protein